MTRPGILGLTRNDLRRFFTDLGQPAYRGDQVFDWIWHRKVIRPDEMTNLPLELRNHLKGFFNWTCPEIIEEHVDSDGTRKFVNGLEGGFRIESVLIPRLDFHASEDEETGRKEGRWTSCTLCVSTQVGCRFRCVFCRSGREGLERNLLAEETAGQLFAAFGRLPLRHKIRQIVLMGIGEPLDNYVNTSQAVRVWLDIEKDVFTGGRIVLSTIGLPDELESLNEEFGGKISLALSLHSSFAGKRKKIVRGAGNEAPRDIINASFRFKLPVREKLTIEYVLVAGLNDTGEDAASLASLLKGKRCIVNLIPLNPVAGMRFKPPPAKRIESFQALLLKNGVRTFIRQRRGASIQAACGQLAFGGK